MQRLHSRIAETALEKCRRCIGETQSLHSGTACPARDSALLVPSLTVRPDSGTSSNKQRAFVASPGGSRVQPTAYTRDAQVIPMPIQTFMDTERSLLLSLSESPMDLVIYERFTEAIRETSLRYISKLVCDDCCIVQQ